MRPKRLWLIALLSGTGALLAPGDVRSIDVPHKAGAIDAIVPLKDLLPGSYVLRVGCGVSGPTREIGFIVRRVENLDDEVGDRHRLGPAETARRHCRTADADAGCH